jgi:hypothetical protein
MRANDLRAGPESFYVCDWLIQLCGVGLARWLARCKAGGMEEVPSFSFLLRSGTPG